MAKCGAPTKAGIECRMAPIDETGRCIGHHPDEAYRARVMSERGTNGRAKVEGNRAAAREGIAGKMSLRTLDGQLTAIDAVLRDVMRCKLDATKRAAAVASLVKVAREVLSADEIQTENRDLRALILERMPELKKHLKAVS